MALIRYPGSKEKLRGPILDRFPDEIAFPLASNRKRWEYREPFFGAGAIGFESLLKIDSSCSVWLNDIDPGMVALWRSVRDHQETLIARISEFDPSPEDAASAFYRFKEEDGRTDLPLDEIGFRKLVLHRTSFSGLGFKAGGPIGGKNQRRDAYQANCRWVPETIKRDIALLGRRLRKFGHFKFTNLDFEECIRGAPRECFIYADPPYVEKGPQLYKFCMGHAEHVRLRDALRDCEASWVLSYDDHPLVRDLYDGWAIIDEVKITYTTATSRDLTRPKNREVVIKPRSAA